MKAHTLIIFDVDGTLVDANIVDYGSFDRAIQEETGITLTSTVWSTFNEVTAQAIVHQALGNDWPELESVKTRIKDSFYATAPRNNSASPSSAPATKSKPSAKLASNTPSTNGARARCTNCSRESRPYSYFLPGDGFAQRRNDCNGKAGKGS